MYSVMAHTSPDTANTDRLVVAVRCVDVHNSATERVLEMKEAIDKTGEGQAKEYWIPSSPEFQVQKAWSTNHMTTLHICPELTGVPNSAYEIKLVEVFHTFLVKTIGTGINPL